MTLSRASLRLVVAAFAATIAFPFAPELRAEDKAPIVVEIDKFQFMPNRVTLRPGDVVIWKNNDIVPHTATAEDGSWDSGSIDAGASWQMSVTEAMLGDYYCVFHPSMVAKLTTRTK